MNINKQNIAIAELCGWSDIKCGPFFQCYGTAPLDSLMDDRQVGMNVPYYTSDLNAMHDAEATLQWIQTDAYLDTLARIVDPIHGYRMNLTFAIAVATAAQRAEAFLRTMGKWEDGE